MLSLSLPGRVFLCTLPTDMRKSFDSLSGLVEQQHRVSSWGYIRGDRHEMRVHCVSARHRDLDRLPKLTPSYR